MKLLTVHGIWFDEESALNRILNLLRKPSSIIILILAAVVVDVYIKLGSIQLQMDHLNRKVAHETNSEHFIDGKVRGLQHQLNSLG